MPDVNLFCDTSYEYFHPGVYKEAGVSLAQSCSLGEDTVIGSKTSVGERAVIKDSVIGRGCSIGAGTVIEVLLPLPFFRRWNAAVVSVLLSSVGGCCGVGVGGGCAGGGGGGSWRSAGLECACVRRALVGVERVCHAVMLSFGHSVALSLCLSFSLSLCRAACAWREGGYRVVRPGRVGA